MFRDFTRRALAPCIAASVGACMILSAVVGPSMAQAAVAEGVFAVVDGETISQDDFHIFLLQFARKRFFHKVPEESLESLRGEAAEALIVQRLLAHEAERRGLSGDPDAVAKKLEGYEEQYKDSEAWPQVQQEWPTLRKRLLEATKVETLVQEVRAVEPPADEELERFHAQRSELFTQPAAARLSVILIGVDPSGGPDEWAVAQEKAAGLLAEVSAGADFAALAREHSSHDSAAQDGDVGWVHEGQLSQPAQEAVNELTPGAVSQPVRVLEGYTLFQLIDRRAAAVSPLAEIKDRVRALYQRERSQQQWDAFLTGLKSRAEIVMGNSPPPKAAE